METQAVRMKILREKYLQHILNGKFLRAKRYRDLKDREEREMKKIRPIIRNCLDELIKQNVMRNKPEITREKAK